MVESSAATRIVYSPLGSKIDYMNGQSTNKGGFVNVPGGAQVLFSTTGVVNAYRHADWLGSIRLSTGTGRGVNTDVAYAPYGERYANSVGTVFNFTGMDNDTKSDLYDFPAREYHPTQGRWISPDPAGLAAVDISNPQSWNRYAYVGNAPCSHTDPLGLSTDCTLNINLQTNALLTNPEITEVRSRISSLLAQAGVGVVFNQSNPDYSLSVTPTGRGSDTFGITPPSWLWGYGLNGIGAPGNSGQVFVLPIASEVNTGNVGLALGTVATHELSHFLTGSFFPGSRQGYVEQEGGTNASWMLDRTLGFANPTAIHNACKRLHPNPNKRVRPGFLGLFGSTKAGSNGPSAMGVVSVCSGQWIDGGWSGGCISMPVIWGGGGSGGGPAIAIDGMEIW